LATPQRTSPASLWRNLKLGAKLSVLGIAISVLCVLGLLIFARTYAPITRQSAGEAQARTASIAVARAFQQWTLDDDQANMYVALIALRDAGQGGLARTTLVQAMEAREAVDPQLALAEDAARDNDSKTLLTRIRHDLTDYDTFVVRMQSDAARGDVKSAVRAVTVDNSPVSDDLTQAFNALEKRTDELAKSNNASIDAVVALGSQRMVEIAAVLVLLTGACLFFVARSIVGPVAMLTRAAGKLAVGDVEVEDVLPAQSRDEIGALADSFRAVVANQKNVALAAESVAGGDLRLRTVSHGETDRLGRAFEAMVANLRSILTSVATASDSLASASEQASGAFEQSTTSVGEISAVIDMVASGADAQSAQIIETATAIEELSRTAEQIAVVAADQANSITSSMVALTALDERIAGLSKQGETLTNSTDEASQEAVSSTAAVNETAATMAELKRISALATSAMTDLEQRSQQVGEIVDTIEEIADQTNLLALNAAIEAARAGDAGRGFAVVADEVRKLADRSRSATATIAKLLQGMKADTGTAADRLRTSVSSMDSGIAVSDRASKSLETVAQGIATTATVAESLAQESRAMRAASLRVTENMASTSAAVEENAAAAAEMRSTTQHVTTVIVPIAATASQNAEVARQASAATKQLTTEIGEIESTARALRDEAANLAALVNRFTLQDDKQKPGAPCRQAPARTAEKSRAASPAPRIGSNQTAMFDWSAAYAVGNDLIDTEHQKLFKYAADLHTAMLERRGTNVVADLLDKLAEYTVTHFAHEEALMRETHYPDRENHFKMHRALLDRVGALQRDAADGRSVVTMQLMDFLKNWLSHHIGKQDQRVADHVRQARRVA